MSHLAKTSNLTKKKKRKCVLIISGTEVQGSAELGAILRKFEHVGLRESSKFCLVFPKLKVYTYSSTFSARYRFSQKIRAIAYVNLLNHH